MSKVILNSISTEVKNDRLDLTIKSRLVGTHFYPLSVSVSSYFPSIIIERIEIDDDNKAR